MQRREAASKFPKHNVFYKRCMEENPKIFVLIFFQITGIYVLK